MKHLIILTITLFAWFSAGAQPQADDASGRAAGWKYAFSKEGRQNWRPEFTARLYSGFITEGPAITGGVRIDDKRTLGLMVWQGDTWIDSALASIYSISTGLYMRRYFHLGQRDIVALYCDFAIGAGYVYKMDGGYETNAETGKTVKTTDYGNGDVMFAATLQPGIRFRFWKNLHLFLGPTVSTNTVGLHLGAGF